MILATVIPGVISSLIAGRFEFICPSIGFVFAIIIVLTANKVPAASDNPYYNRAIYHAKRDPHQATADYTQYLDQIGDDPKMAGIRRSILKIRLQLHEELGMTEEAKAGAAEIVDQLNGMIRDSKKSPSQAKKFIKERDDLVRAHQLTLKTAPLFGHCILCGRNQEGRSFGFSYGKLSGAGILPIPGVGIIGGSSYRITGHKSCHLCYQCYSGFSEERGSKLAIRAMKPALKKQGYDSFFTPDQMSSMTISKG